MKLIEQTNNKEKIDKVEMCLNPRNKLPFKLVTLNVNTLTDRNNSMSICVDVYVYVYVVCHSISSNHVNYSQTY